MLITTDLSAWWPPQLLMKWATIWEWNTIMTLTLLVSAPKKGVSWHPLLGKIVEEQMMWKEPLASWYFHLTKFSFLLVRKAPLIGAHVAKNIWLSLLNMAWTTVCVINQSGKFSFLENFSYKTQFCIFITRISPVLVFQNFNSSSLVLNNLVTLYLAHQLSCRWSLTIISSICCIYSTSLLLLPDLTKILHYELYINSSHWLTTFYSCFLLSTVYSKDQFVAIVSLKTEKSVIVVYQKNAQIIAAILLLVSFAEMQRVPPAHVAIYR